MFMCRLRTWLENVTCSVTYQIKTKYITLSAAWFRQQFTLYLFERSEFLIATCKKKKLTFCLSVRMFG